MNDVDKHLAMVLIHVQTWFKKKCFWLSVILIFILLISSEEVYADIDHWNGGYRGHFSVVHRGRLYGHTVLMVVENVDLTECIHYCIKHRKCATINYNTDEKLCELSRLEFDEYEGDTEAIGWLNYGTPQKVDGQFSEWMNKTSCSKSCGGGEQVLYRLCNNPAPQHGGNECDGPNEKILQCNEQSCPLPCPDYGMGYPGSDIMDISNVPSWELCSGYCKLLKECRAWTYITDVNNCYLKSGIGGRVSSLNGISGLRNCGDTLPCPEENIGYVGTLKVKYSYFNAWEHCSAISKECNDCIAWVWSQEKKRCYLFSTINKRETSSDNPVLWSNTVSGLQLCGRTALIHGPTEGTLTAKSISVSLCKIHKIEFEFQPATQISMAGNVALITMKQFQEDAIFYSLDYASKVFILTFPYGIDQVILSSKSTVLIEILKKVDETYCMKYTVNGVNAHGCWTFDHPIYIPELLIETKDSTRLGTFKNFYIHGVGAPNDTESNCVDEPNYTPQKLA